MASDEFEMRFKLLNRARMQYVHEILLPQPPLHCRKLPYVPCRDREVAQARRFLHHAHSSSWCLQKERYQTI
ncbi:hypothetical protein LOK49_LG08G01305 [Camellia lanceoleosa]|uniref:Uncharacterized protein n=1 Tax=Camellia lanceoleosa TaxID=1840588 RepID=A0ACC0GPK5_9ERIC|nr:hypothetical protein LOK49_LG08G01305 [Camellia lanceoleosa]